MKFVDENIIDTVASDLDINQYNPEEEKVFLEHQPAIAAYLISNGFSLLTKAEQDYLAFLALIIYKSVMVANPDVAVVSEKQLGDTEEENWSILNASTERRFHKRIDPFFEDYDQEDLLAFVEDALGDDEEGIVTREGKELLFIALKTLIDCLTTPK